MATGQTAIAKIHLTVITIGHALTAKYIVTAFTAAAIILTDRITAVVTGRSIPVADRYIGRRRVIVLQYRSD
jgi:hypothetical protein